jgi:hypothetical protein
VERTSQQRKFKRWSEAFGIEEEVCVGGRLLVDVVVDVDHDGKPVPNTHDAEPSIFWLALANFHHINHGI